MIRRAMEALRRVGASVAPALPGLRDLHIYGGAALFASGVWLFWPPGALMAAGALLVHLGLKAGR